MPTVIDSLIITLGLDPSAFEKGQKDAIAAFKKAQDEAKKSAKEQEQAAKDLHASLGKATQGVLDLMAAFLGGRGIKEFIKDAAQANNALGNLSLGLGSSPQLLSAWGMAAERMGGSAGATQASIQTLSDSLTDLRTQGKALPDALFQLEAKSGVNVDFLHGWEKLTVGLATAASTLAKTDPVAANRFLRQLGLDPVTAQLLIQQGPRMQAYLQTMKRLAPSNRDIQASQGLTNAWATLSQQFSQLATKIATAIAPMLTLFAEKLGAVVESVSKFVAAHPNLTSGFAAIFLVLTGAKILSSIKNILALRSALLGLSAANSASSSVGLLGLLGRLGVVGAVAAGVADTYEHSTLNEGEDEIARQRKYGQSGGRPLSGNSAVRRRGSGGGVGSVRTDGAPEGHLTELISSVARETAGGDAKMETYLRTHLEGIRAGESLHKQNWYDKKDDAVESSWGPYQLNRRRGMGVQFEKDTGLDVRDPSSIPAQTRWVAKYLKQGGSLRPWTSWPSHGPQEANPNWGDSGYKPSPAKQPLWTGIDGARKAQPIGAGHVAALSNIANDNRATTTSNSNEMHIAGGVHVNAPQATDAHGIAKHIDAALAHNMFASYANFGPY